MKNSLIGTNTPTWGLFSQSWWYAYLAILAGIVILGFVYNFMYYKKWSKKYQKMYLGLIPLGFMLFTWSLSGIGSEYWVVNTFYYILLQLGQVLAFVCLMLSLATNNKKDNVKYLATTMVLASVIVVVELIYCFITRNVVSDAGQFNKYKMILGWAVQNLAATYLVFAVPFSYYLFFINRGNFKKWIYFGYCIFLGVMTFITMSRSNIATLMVIYAACSLHWLHSSKHQPQTFLWLMLLWILGFSYIVAIWDDPNNPIAQLFGYGFSLNGRGPLNDFSKYLRTNYPIFGGGWFCFDLEGVEGVHKVSWFTVIPQLFSHNFVNELLGVTGVVGTIGFISYLGFIVFITFYDYKQIKLLFLLCFIALIIDSIFDNFFFNMDWQRIYVIWTSYLLALTHENKPLHQTLQSVISEY